MLPARAADAPTMRRPIVLLPTPVPVSFTWGGLLPMVLLGAGFASMSHTHSAAMVMAAAVIGGIGGAVSLVVHELGHVVAARRVAGVRAARISLIWMGGATYFNGAYRSGRDQIRVALGGPAASFLFAFPMVGAMALPLPVAVRFAIFLLALLNVAIAVLTLLPVHPLDGHKLILGALWWMVGSKARARKILRRAAIACIALDLTFGAVLMAQQPLYGMLAAALVVSAFAQKHLLRAPNEMQMLEGGGADGRPGKARTS
jgi:Zn-dependent protease